MMSDLSDVVPLATQGVQVPTREIVGVILVAAKHDGVPWTAQPQMDASNRFLVAHQKSKHEAPTGTVKFGKAPLPGIAKRPSLLARFR